MEKETVPKPDMDHRVVVVWRHMFLNLLVLIAPFQSRTEYVMRLCNNDVARATALQNYMSAGAGFMEFLLNPMLGRLSDVIGRKPFLLISPAVNLLLKLLVYFSDGKSFLLLAADRIIGGAITTVGGSTACGAAISDVLKGSDLAGALGNLGSYAGLGVLIGPLLVNRILSFSGQLKHTYLFGAVVAAFQLLYNTLYFTETLDPSHKKPMDWSACSPLKFVRIFSGDSTVAQLSLVAGLQCFPEGKSLADMNMAYTRTVIKMSEQMQTAFVMSFGGAMTLAGSLPKLLIPEQLSQRNFTSLSNYLTVAALTIWGASKEAASFWLGLALLCPSMERRAATSAMATDLAFCTGMGKGEFSGCFANWRALCVAVSPLVYGFAFQHFGKKVPGAAYFAAAAVTLATEFIFRSIPGKQLHIGKAYACLEAKQLWSAVTGDEGCISYVAIQNFLQSRPDECSSFKTGRTSKAFLQDIDNGEIDTSACWKKEEWEKWYIDHYKDC